MLVNIIKTRDQNEWIHVTKQSKVTWKRPECTKHLNTKGLLKDKHCGIHLWGEHRECINGPVEELTKKLNAVITACWWHNKGIHKKLQTHSSPNPTCGGQEENLVVNLGGQLGVLRAREMGLLTASSGNIKESSQLTTAQVTLSCVPTTYHLAYIRDLIWALQHFQWLIISVEYRNWDRGTLRNLASKHLHWVRFKPCLPDHKELTLSLD